MSNTTTFLEYFQTRYPKFHSASILPEGIIRKLVVGTVTTKQEIKKCT